MEYESITSHYSKNDQVKSLYDSEIKKFSGFVTLVGLGDNQKAFDSIDESLVLYYKGDLAEIVEKGIDHEHLKLMQHIKNVRSTCNRLGCTPSELLKKDYLNELKN